MSSTTGSSKTIKYTLYGVVIFLIIELASCVFSTGNDIRNFDNQMRQQAGLVGHSNMGNSITHKKKFISHNTRTKSSYRSSRSGGRRR